MFNDAFHFLLTVVSNKHPNYLFLFVSVTFPLKSVKQQNECCSFPSANIHYSSKTNMN